MTSYVLLIRRLDRSVLTRALDACVSAQPRGKDGTVDKPGSWVRRLATDDRTQYDHACSEQTWQEFTERLGPSAAAWSVAAAREITAAVLGALPRFADGVGERRAVGKGIEGGVLCILASVYSDAVVDPATP